MAMDRERTIGRDGTLPWHLPEDLKRFRAITMGKPIIMGRRTHASIGRALPGRRNLVLTRDRDYAAPGCEVCVSLEDALARCADAPEVMIIGGAAVYRAALARAERLYLTEVDADVGGDVHFPPLDAEAWREVACEPHPRDARNAHDFRFRVLERVPDRAEITRGRVPASS
ncbi:MAG: dihydrofolate reductase [Gammaproteobacteria bacterium]